MVDLLAKSFLFPIKHRLHFLVGEVLLTRFIQSCATELHSFRLNRKRYIIEHFSNMSTGTLEAIEVSVDIMRISEDPLVPSIEFLHFFF